MIKKINLLMLCMGMLFVPITKGFSQKKQDQPKYCRFSSDNNPANDICPNVQFNSFRTDEDIEKAVNDITSIIGLKPNFILIPCPDIQNAAALIYQDNLRYIVYDKKFLDGISKNVKSNWSNTMILAHEIGHHLNGHTLTSENKETTRKEELEADEFAGFILGKMGASKDEAIAAMNGIPHPDCDVEYFSDHPCKEKRIEAIEKGWSKATGKKVKATSKQKSEQTKSIPVQKSTLKGTWYTELDNERGTDGIISLAITFMEGNIIHYRFFNPDTGIITDEFESKYTLENDVLIEVLPYNPNFKAKAKVQMLSKRALLLTIVDNGIAGYEGLKRVYIRVEE
ncbi:MAG: hypothetical protein IT220_11035 [Flavobacteriaceae bacterium]|nr:hypothetical protein [Flavobacteriaceae bacterium]